MGLLDHGSFRHEDVDIDIFMFRADSIQQCVAPWTVIGIALPNTLPYVAVLLPNKCSHTTFDGAMALLDSRMESRLRL